MAEDNPFAAGASPPSAESPPFANFGRNFGTAFQVYFQRWRDWLAPMLVAVAVAVAAMCCCYFPMFLVFGPLACGLYACALATLRGRPIDSDTLWRGWPAAWNAMVAHLVILVLTLLPMILLYILPMFVFQVLFVAHGVNHHPPGPPGPWMFVFMIGGFGLMMLGVFLATAWTLFLETRTIFILPLIADRGMDFGEAWRTSWQSTRRAFWELLLLQFLAGLIGGLGVYACCVGLLFTLPIRFTIIAAAYEDRFGPVRPADGIAPSPAAPPVAG